MTVLRVAFVAAGVAASWVLCVALGKTVAALTPIPYPYALIDVAAAMVVAAALVLVLTGRRRPPGRGKEWSR